MDTLLDCRLIDDIRKVEQATGRADLFAGFVNRLEQQLTGFGGQFAAYVAGGDPVGAVRAAHTLKGACGQLGALALRELFSAIEASAKAGDYAEAKRKYESSAGLIAESLDALKRA
jgi:HPt (histidine-containing phosphotransfer) domain-containing protein